MGFDLQPTDEQQALKQTLGEFAADVLRPAARDAEAAKRTPEAIARQIHEIGIAAPVDEAHGGGGTFDAVTYCMAAEELAWGDPAIAYQALGGGLAALVIGRAGTDEQRASHLPVFTKPAPGGSFVAVAEKVAVGDLESLDTTVDGHQVAGRKYGVLDAEEARVGIVVGRSRDGDLAAAIVTPKATRSSSPRTSWDWRRRRPGSLTSTVRATPFSRARSCNRHCYSPSS